MLLHQESSDGGCTKKHKDTVVYVTEVKTLVHDLCHKDNNNQSQSSTSDENKPLNVTSDGNKTHTSTTASADDTESATRSRDKKYSATRSGHQEKKKTIREPSLSEYQNVRNIYMITLVT